MQINFSLSWHQILQLKCVESFDMAFLDVSNSHRCESISKHETFSRTHTHTSTHTRLPHALVLLLCVIFSSLWTLRCPSLLWYFPNLTICNGVILIQKCGFYWHKCFARSTSKLLLHLDVWESYRCVSDVQCCERTEPV